MQDTAAKSATAAVELKDARLFREACYLDGQWVQAKSGAMINVDNPATGEIRGRALRRRERVGPRPRGVQVRNG
jgi:hypothetical protein